MPIVTNNFGTYVPTCDQFNAHWTSVNADRVAATLPAITLKQGYTRANFETDRDALEVAIGAIEGLENGRELATGGRDSQKTALSDRLGQFRDALSVHLKETPYFSAAPTIPSFSSAESKWLRPFDDMANLWTRINAETSIDGFTPPLLLRAGYTLANFTADLAAMRTQFKAVTTAEEDENLGRKKRNALLPPIRARMLQYRKEISLQYGEGTPFYDSLPDLYASGPAAPTLPTFPFNWQMSGANLLLWFEMLAGLVGVTNLYLLENGSEFTTGVVLQPGERQQVTWSGVTVVGEVDEVALRNADNEVLAIGVRDETLPDPGP